MRSPALLPGLLGLCVSATAVAQPEGGAPGPAPQPATPTIMPTVTPTVRITPLVDVVASYAFRRVEADGTSSWFHAFDVPRVHAGLTVERGRVRARVLGEAVRSAAEGSLLGVDGDSLVFRVREAWAEVTPHQAIALSGGVIPTAAVPAFETAWDLRAVGPGIAEEAGLLVPADLGAQARVTAGRWGTATFSSTNGEGYAQRELNRGKSTEVVVEVHPLAGDARLAPLALVLGGIEGSTGTARARADRALGGLLWRGARVRGGADLVHAWGQDGDGARQGWAGEAFVRAEPWAALVVGARVARWQRDVDVAGDRTTRLDLAAGWRLEPGVEALAIGTRTEAGTEAEAAGVAVDAWELRATLRVRL